MGEEDSAKLIISNLPSEYSSDELYDLFGSFGNIQECDCKWGIGFVEFSDSEEAEAAFRKMSAHEVEKGKTIKIDFPGRKEPVSRLVVKNLPPTDYSEDKLRELFDSFGAIIECVYMWGYGFIKFKQESSVDSAIAEMKGYEIDGRKIQLEVQGPNGEVVRKKGARSSGIQIKSEGSVGDGAVDGFDHPKVGHVRLFIGNLTDGTSEDEVRQICEPFGEVKKIDVKGNFAFAHFMDAESCKAALTGLAKKQVEGKTLRVQLAEIKKGGKIFVGNLQEDQDPEELLTTFARFGNIVEFKSVRKFAFITYDDPNSASRAVSALDRSNLGDSKIKVQYSTSERHNDPDGCHSCGAPGHIAKFCPNDRKDACHKCGGYGHWAKECSGQSNGRPRSRSPMGHSRRRSPYGAGYEIGYGGASMHSSRYGRMPR